MANKWSLVGVYFAGVQRTQQQQQEPPCRILLGRAEMANLQRAELQAKFSADGFCSCILKG